MSFTAIVMHIRHTLPAGTTSFQELSKPCKACSSQGKAFYSSLQQDAAELKLADGGLGNKMEDRLTPIKGQDTSA